MILNYHIFSSFTCDSYFPMRNNFEVIFNNGEKRQILMLPEAPIRIAFSFAAKELTLRQKKRAEGLYYISHLKGFDQTDSDVEYSDKEIEAFQDNDNCTDSRLNSIIFEWCRQSPSNNIASKEKSIMNITDLERFTDLIKSLKDKQIEVDENEDVDTVCPVVIPKTKQKPCVCGTNGLFIQSKPAENSLSEQSSVIKENATKRTKSFVEDDVDMVIDKGESSTNQLFDNQSDVTTSLKNPIDLSQSLENAALNKKTRKAERLEDDNNMEIHTELCWSDESVDGKESKKSQKVCTVLNKKSSPKISQDGRLILPKESEILETCSNASVMHVESNLSEKVINDYISGCQNDLEVEFSGIPSSATNNTQNQPKEIDLSSVHTKKQRCSFCLKHQVKGGKRKMHKFPRCCEISNMWAKASGLKCMIQATPAERRKKFHICNDHFLARDYASSKKIRLKWCAVPTQNLPMSSKPKASHSQNTNIFESVKSKLNIALKRSRFKS